MPAVLYWINTALDCIALAFMALAVLFVGSRLVRGQKFEP